LQIIYIFKGDAVTCKDPNGQQSGTFHLYPTQRPKAIDITVDGRLTRAIYQLNDDMLTLSLDLKGEARPVDFDGKGGAVVYILKKTDEQEGAANRASGKKPAQPTTGEPPVAFANSPGWAWSGAPQPRREFGTSGGRGNTFGGGYSYILAEDKDGASLVYLAFSTNESILDYRPVAFDAEGKRYVFKATIGGAYSIPSTPRLIRFRSTPSSTGWLQGLRLHSSIACGLRGNRNPGAESRRNLPR
jgi:hypothetical protein